MRKAIIYDIQRFSLHDGPGIRTTIFFKGCPLRCLWCANPESQSFECEVMGNSLIGKEYSVKQLLDIVLRDKVFYEKSGGGITFSGGEPLAQVEFLKEFISLAKEHKLHLSIETSGYQNFDDVKDVITELDFIYYDLKTFDSDLHKDLTGVNNDLIFENLEKIKKINSNVIVRIPVIPSKNDSLLELKRIALWCYQNDINDIELLLYHRYGVHKYEKLGREYKLDSLPTHDKDVLKEMCKLIKKDIPINIFVS